MTILNQKQSNLTIANIFVSLRQEAKLVFIIDIVNTFDELLNSKMLQTYINFTDHEDMENPEEFSCATFITLDLWSKMKVNHDNEILYSDSIFVLDIVKHKDEYIKKLSENMEMQ